MSNTPHLAGQKIRQFRAEHEPPLSAEEFAEEYGFSLVMVYRWEAQGKVPLLRTVMRFNTLGICAPEDWLLPAEAVA